ncbi:hypothetical protein EV197_0210 [Aquimarina brevivitae]|uniref:Uncharacterized protein n=1 Tax=Aquimarina brevivitae TaxID=323412 RepID=A0A4Q7PGI8_9FLAO|nr:hypothetical protein EV197_0210 [Aquimarina brevivitae]
MEDYLIILVICAPIFLFIIGVVFRLLDNSASIFLDNEISIDSSYVSEDLIQAYIKQTENDLLRKSLKRALFFRKMHNLFMILMVISIPPVIIAMIIYF